MAAGAAIRVGVVGLGAFGRHHARHYAANPAATLVAVADVDPARAEAAARGYGAVGYTDHRQLFGKVDAVSIAVPASEHYRVAGDLLDAGIHVLIEKPIALDSASARDLIRRAEAAGAILQVGHIERFSPAVAELRDRLANPRRMAAVRRTPWSGRSTDVDVVLDLMIHDIDLVLTLARAPVVSVAANGASVESDDVDEAEGWLTFADGMIATLSASRVAAANERRLTITEPRTVFVADLGGPSLTMTRRTSGAAAQAISLIDRDNLGAEVAAFLDCIVAGTTPVVDGAAGLAALAIAERIQAAIADGAVPARRRI